MKKWFFGVFLLSAVAQAHTPVAPGYGGSGGQVTYAGGDTVGAGTVEAAIDELSTEKADITDMIPGWPFTLTVLPSGNPTTYGIVAADKCLVSTSGGTSVSCFASGTARSAGVFKVAGATGGFVHSLTCALDTVTGAGSGDVLTLGIVSDTLNGGSLTTMPGSTLTFTQGTDLASNTGPKVVVIDAAIPTADAGVEIRATLTDGNASVTSLAFNCTLSGYMP